MEYPFWDKVSCLLNHKTHHCLTLRDKDEIQQHLENNEFLNLLSLKAAGVKMDDR